MFKKQNSLTCFFTVIETKTTPPPNDPPSSLPIGNVSKASSSTVLIVTLIVICYSVIFEHLGLLQWLSKLLGLLIERGNLKGLKERGAGKRTADSTTRDIENGNIFQNTSNLPGHIRTMQKILTLSSTSCRGQETDQ